MIYQKTSHGNRFRTRSVVNMSCIPLMILLFFCVDFANTTSSQTRGLSDSGTAYLKSRKPETYLSPRSFAFGLSQATMTHVTPLDK